MGHTERFWRNDLDWSSWLSPPPQGRLTYIYRRYPHKWQVALYQPMGRIESWARGAEVCMEHDAVYKELGQYRD